MKRDEGEVQKYILTKNKQRDSAEQLLFSLYQETADDLADFLYHAGISPADAEDAIQEAFYAVQQKLEKDGAEGLDLRNFLFIVTRNKALDGRRAMVRRRKYEEMAGRNQPTSAEDGTLDRLALENLVEKARAMLSPFEFEVFRMKFVENRKLKEISALTERSMSIISRLTTRISEKIVNSSLTA